MKLQTTLIAVALAFAGSAASAATVGSFTDLTTGVASSDPTVGPAGVGVHSNTEGAGTVDDVYNFNIAAESDLFTYAKEFEATNTSLNPAMFTLFSGTSDGTAATAGTEIGSTFSFAGGDALTTTYSNLAAGSYYFEVTGTAAGLLGSSYELDTYANAPGNPLPAVPEPGNMALLLAGLGLMGFMAKRRARD